jgi:hypothetical protein
MARSRGLGDVYKRQHEELDNRALLPALPISVRALLNPED